jgi:hypothetical protein
MLDESIKFDCGVFFSTASSSEGFVTVDFINEFKCPNLKQIDDMPKLPSSTDNALERPSIAAFEEA